MINNNSFGISAGGSPGIVARVSNTTITRNDTGIRTFSGASVLSFGDNKLAGNRNGDGTFTASVITKQ